MGVNSFTPINSIASLFDGTGRLAIDLPRLIGSETHSSVYDHGSAASRTYTMAANRYGGVANGVLQIRGSVSSFAQDAAVPVWEEYTVPISRAWRYVQIGETTSSLFDQSSGTLAVNP